MLPGMNNPYQPPEGRPVDAAPNKRIFVLAGIGALAASAYWGLQTLVRGLSAASSGSSLSFIGLVLPAVLVVAYATRGFQLFKGDVSAAASILFLHGIGGLMAMLQMAQYPEQRVLQVVKLLIHIFGGVTAYLARKSVTG
jgi:hypothetical protein